jgi:hypothetical protein
MDQVTVQSLHHLRKKLPGHAAWNRRFPLRARITSSYRAVLVGGQFSDTGSQMYF